MLQIPKKNLIQYIRSLFSKKDRETDKKNKVLKDVNNGGVK